MVAAPDLVQLIAEGTQEVFVGRDDGPVEVELDGGLSLVHRRHLALEFGKAVSLLRYVGRELDDLVGFARGVQDRVVGGLDPDLLVVLAETLVRAGVELASPKLGPERLVGRARGVVGLAERPMMDAPDLVPLIAESVQKVVVGGDDGPVEVELDGGLRLVHRRDLSLELGGPVALLGDVGGELDDLVGLAGSVEDRVVGGLDPDLLVVLAEPSVGRRLRLALPQVRPELLISRGRHFGRIAEHAVVLAADLVEAVAEARQKVLVRGEHDSIEVEFDGGLHPVDRRQDRRHLALGAPAFRHRAFGILGARHGLRLPSLLHPSLGRLRHRLPFLHFPALNPSRTGAGEHFPGALSPDP